VIAAAVIIVLSCVGLAWACCALSGRISEQEELIRRRWDEIEAKDQALTHEHHELSVVNKQIETVKTTLELEKSNHKKAKELIERQQNQVNKLTFIIKEAHEEHEKLKKDY
jgi:hypothetical protein